VRCTPDTAAALERRPLPVGSGAPLSLAVDRPASPGTTQILGRCNAHGTPPAGGGVAHGAAHRCKISCVITVYTHDHAC